MTRRLALFAHFDADNEIKPYILFHLQALRSLAVEIHFVSNSPLPERELGKLESLVDKVQLRENTGLDFSMWQAALRNADLGAFDELILTNSSVVGPLFALAPIFLRMGTVPCDFWGMTESREMCPHLQSYFLVFRKTVLESPGFQRFWASVLPYRSKFHVIHSYELGLGTFLEEQGLRGGVAFPLEYHRRGRSWIHRAFSRRLSRNNNPVLHHQEHLLDLGMPYVKVALLQDLSSRDRLIRSLRQVRGLNFDLSLLG